MMNPQTAVAQIHSAKTLLFGFVLVNSFGTIITSPLHSESGQLDIGGHDPAVRFIEPFSSDDPVPTELPSKTVKNLSKVDKSFATHYLKEFGYIDKANGNFTKALRLFQQFAELPVTGVLDESTRLTMIKPRCGNKDLEEYYEEQPNPLDLESTGKKRRQKRYNIEGSYWGVKSISYRVSLYPVATHVIPTPMKHTEVDDVIKRAFNVWEVQSPLRFERKVDGPVNLEIKFASGSHGDGEPFDGRGQILAHAFFPRYGGDVHFDADESWQSLQTKGIDLYSVAAHEIGHSLGLKHSNNHQALMAPFYQGHDDDVIRLHSDDVKGLQKLYGKPPESLNIIPPEKPEKVGFFGSPNPKKEFDICDDPRVDAVTVLGNGSTYAFRGDQYWKLNELSYEAGYPRSVTADWDGLPGDIDASVTDYDGDTYFFKRDEYWLFDPNGRRYKGYPRKISLGLVDTPDDVSAALIWSYDEKPYFFKGSQYWQYSRWGMPSTWPRRVDEIFDGTSDMPHKIDAALKWSNNKSYLFAGSVYYRLNTYRLMKIAPGYPRDIGEWWFGCKQPNRNKRQAIDYRDK